MGQDAYWNIWLLCSAWVVNLSKAESGETLHGIDTFSMLDPFHIVPKHTDETITFTT